VGVVAGDIIREWIKTRLFGRPYLKFGQCLDGLWPYVFEIGGILGAKYAATLDAFLSAFLGMPDQAGEAKRICAEIANKLVERHSVDSMTARDCVQADIMERSGYTRDEFSFLLKYGPRKISPEEAAENAWTYASIGAALGAVHPDVLQAMYERTHAQVPKEEWRRAYAAGLDIGPDQPRQRNYRQAEEEENKDFMEYCREARPDLYSILKR